MFSCWSVGFGFSFSFQYWCGVNEVLLLVEKLGRQDFLHQLAAASSLKLVVVVWTTKQAENLLRERTKCERSTCIGTPQLAQERGEPTQRAAPVVPPPTTVARAHEKLITFSGNPT